MLRYDPFRLQSVDVSGLYDPKSSVIAEVLAQECLTTSISFDLPEPGITVDSVDLHFYHGI